MTKDDLSGADIKAVCTEAGLLALRERRMRVTKQDFTTAREKVHAFFSQWWSLLLTMIFRFFIVRTRVRRRVFISRFSKHFLVHLLPYRYYFAPCPLVKALNEVVARHVHNASTLIETPMSDLSRSPSPVPGNSSDEPIIVPPSLPSPITPLKESYTYHSPLPTADGPYILGVDEAGRGPVLGPLVYGIAYCAVSFKEELDGMGFAGM